MRRVVVLTSLAVLALPAPAAFGESVVSSNWSGYVAHRSGTTFRAVTGSWRQPAATCRRNRPKYSSTWIGLGGYLPSSVAAEQLGTELDCNVAGRQVVLARYELLPAPVKTIRMTVRPGDRLSATVTLARHHVSFRLLDVTRHETFARTFNARVADASSADWIVEAPAACLSADDCQILPLADFGSVRITQARAETARRRWGSISSRLWSATRIVLLPSMSSFDADGIAGASTPTAVRGGGAMFDVDYKQMTIGSLPANRTASGARRGAISWRLGGSSGLRSRG